MCRETLTVAQCAPEVSPVLAFYCAKLHLVAKDRIVCDAARGKCICFFGSCGIIDREIPTKGINLSDVVKARCAECTPREHRVGNGLSAKQILESVLLRSTDAQNGWEERSKLISELWLNKPACPYHAETSTESADAIVEAISIDQPVCFDANAAQSCAGLTADPTSESSDLKPGFEDAVEKNFSGFSGSERAAPKDSSSTPVGPIFADSLVAEPASSPADEWTTNTAPAGEEGDNTDNHGFDSEVKNILDPEEVGIATSRWAPGNSASNSSQPTVQGVEANGNEQGQGQEQEQEQGQGQTPVVAISRRAVNFAYDPNNAEKLLETTEKFASVKAFLMATKA
ncbi:hypothetical protein FGADI_3294 [Fusarium gaditjirri]|uniref:Uncharacterized protein n=1 Tax=Fusarium gaditjirri TaxID=282569 RepID=A0A8H4X154_9HYPO|nr:hypothetical protein FGADI_3294 [Fusarium gaditjirri]